MRQIILISAGCFFFIALLLSIQKWSRFTKPLIPQITVNNGNVVFCYFLVIVCVVLVVIDSIVCFFCLFWMTILLHCENKWQNTVKPTVKYNIHYFIFYTKLTTLRGTRTFVIFMVIINSATWLNMVHKLLDICAVNTLLNIKMLYEY